jgi:hypothetical protein
MHELVSVCEAVYVNGAEGRSVCVAVYVVFVPSEFLELDAKWTTVGSVSVDCVAPLRLCNSRSVHIVASAVQTF